MFAIILYNVYNKTRMGGDYHVRTVAVGSYGSSVRGQVSQDELQKGG